MPNITPDFSEAVEATPIPDGVYNARITEAKVEKAKKSGDAFLKWKLTIFGAEGDAAKYNGWPVFYNTMIGGKGAGMLKTLIKAATGVEPAGAFDTDELLGKEVTLTLKQRMQEDGTPAAWPDVKSVKAYLPF